MHHLPIAGLAAALLFAEPAGAQPCYSENGGNTFDDSVAMGTAIVGVKFKPTTSLDCIGIEIFTGEKPGVHKLEIWKHDPNADEPSVALGGGTMNTGTNNNWEGAGFQTPVHLDAGQAYWMVWHPVNNAQASVEPPQATLGQFHRESTDGGATWGGGLQSSTRHWKFRLYSDSELGEYGSGCVGLGGKRIFWSALEGCPCPGNTITLELDGDGGKVLILLGKDGNSTPINPTCDLQINPLHSLVVSFTKPSGPLPLPATIPAGTPTPLLITAQAFLVGPSGADGVASTKPIYLQIE